MESHRFAANYSIQLIGRILTLFVGLLTIGILTRGLTTTEFGDFTIGLTFLQFFGIIVDFGLTLSLVVMISEPGADHKRIVGNIFSMRMISGLIVFGLAPIIVLAFPYSSSVRDVVFLGAFGYLCMSGATLLVGIFQRHAVMWRAAVAELLNRVVLLGLIMLVLSSGLGLQSIIAATVLSNILWLIATIFLAHRYTPITLRFDRDVWKEAIHRSWPIAISIIFNLIYLKGDILFLSIFRESADVAIYGVAYKVIDVLTALPVMFMGLLLPSLVATWSENNKELFRTQMKHAFDIFAIVTIPLAVGAQIVGTPLVELIAGDKYTASGPLLQFLILALVAVFFSSLYGHAIVAVNKQKPMIWGYAATAVIAIIGYLTLIPLYGAWGAATVTLVSEILIAVICYMVVRKTSGAIPSLTITIKAVACAALMYGVLILLPSVHVLIDVSIGAIVYLASMVAIGGIDFKKIQSLVKLST